MQKQRNKPIYTSHMLYDKVGGRRIQSYHHQGVLWPCHGRTPERSVLVWPPNSNPHPQKKENHLRVCVQWKIKERGLNAIQSTCFINLRIS